MKSALVILTGLFLAQTGSAATCHLKISRDACAGKERESYSKCEGNKSCVKEFTAATEKDCMALALTNCENKRFDITQYKSVQAKFDGRDVRAGYDFCSMDSGAYKVIENYPFRGKAACK